MMDHFPTAPALLSLICVAQADNLLNLSDLAHVDVRLDPDNPTRTIIHIADWHLVLRDDFEADARDQGFTDPKQIERFYADHLKEVDQRQAWQREVVLRLLAQHKLDTAYLEGVTPEDLDKLLSCLDFLQGHPKLRTPDRMRLIGVLGQLYVQGKLRSIKPAEDAEAHRDANPVQPAGTIKIGRAKQESRETAIVKKLTDPVNLVVLGEAHDLKDNITDGKTRYLVVSPVRADKRD